jgi:integrase
MKATSIKEPVRIRRKQLTNGNKSLILDTYIQGKRNREYLRLYLIPEHNKADKDTNANTLRLANAIKSKRIVELQNNEHGFKNTSIKANTKVIDYINFLADEELGKTGNKRSYYYTFHSLIKHVTAYAGDNTTFKQVDSEFVRKFIVYLRSAKNFNFVNSTKGMEDTILSLNTQHNLFKKFAYVIKKAIKAEILSVNPLDKIDDKDKPKSEESRREYLTIEEIKKLIKTECRNEMIKRSFLFCCLCGLRYSDVNKLTWGEFQTGNQGETVLRLRVTKTKRYEDFPISNEALKWLPDKGNAKDADSVFTLPKNDHANMKLQKWCKDAGINKKISFHCSRHTAATLNLSLGIPIETVSKLLGHTKISTTQIYAKIIDEKKKEAVNMQNGIFD